jgi:hypothetical protein
MISPQYEEAVFEAASPPKLLWEYGSDLFETVISEYTADANS